MTLPVSPNSISLSQVNVELNRAATALISMNDAEVRSLAGVASGAISMSNLYGKSNSGTFVSLGIWDGSQRTAYSALKTTWSAGTTIGSYPANNMDASSSYGNNILLVSFGVARWSNNGGATWSSSGSSLGTTQCVIGGNRAVIRVTGNQIYYSDFPNPTTWTLASIPANTIITDIEYHQGYGFVGVCSITGAPSNNRWAYSADGASWSANANFPRGTNGNYTSAYIASGNGRLVGIGTTPGNNVSFLQVAYSTDNGASWTSVNYPATNGLLESISYVGNNTFLMTGRNQVVHRSTDGGVSWTAVNLPDQSAEYRASTPAIADGNGNVLIHGRNNKDISGGQKYNSMMVSNDYGATWSTMLVSNSSTFTGWGSMPRNFIGVTNTAGGVYTNRQRYFA